MKRLCLWMLMASVFMSSNFCLIGSSLAQSKQDTPESVSERYIAALHVGDWAKCATFMHPDALAQLKKVFTELVDREKSGLAVKRFLGIQTSAELAQLSDAQIFQRLMNFLTSRDTDVKAALASATSTVIGSVSESPDLAHVVYRVQMTVKGAQVKQTEVMSLRRNGQSWSLLLSGEIDALLAALSSVK